MALSFFAYFGVRRFGFHVSLFQSRLLTASFLSFVLFFLQLVFLSSLMYILLPPVLLCFVVFSRLGCSSFRLLAYVSLFLYPCLVSLRFFFSLFAPLRCF